MNNREIWRFSGQKRYRHYYGGREWSPAPAFKIRAANVKAARQMQKPRGKCKSRAANAKAARQMLNPRGKCKKQRGYLNIVHSVSHYHVGIESRFVFH